MDGSPVWLELSFHSLLAQTVEPCTTILDFISREKMIDNICMIIQGALNQKAPKELAEKVHPLGVFEGMKEIMSDGFEVQDNLTQHIGSASPSGRWHV